MGILLCEQNFRDVWRRNKSVRAEIGQILRTHTHTHAAKLVVRIITTAIISSTLDYFILKLNFSLQSSSMSRHVTRQRVQNCLGIVVTQCLLYSHSPPILNVSLDVHG